MNTLYAWGNIVVAGWESIPISIMEYVVMFTLTPRFILNLRELYARNVQGRRASAGGIDTGFGLSTVSSGAGESAVMFADAEGLEHGEEIAMGEMA